MIICRRQRRRIERCIDARFSQLYFCSADCRLKLGYTKQDYTGSFYSKADHPRMRVFCYLCSLPVTW